MIPYSSMWYHSILLNNITFWVPFLPHEANSSVFLEFHLTMTCSLYWNLLLLPLQLFFAQHSSSVLSLSQRFPWPITEAPSYCQWLVILFLSLGRNTCFQYNLTFLSAFWAFSNIESVCIKELELQSQNMNPEPFVNTFQQNKTWFKYLEKNICCFELLLWFQLMQFIMKLDIIINHWSL